MRAIAEAITGMPVDSIDDARKCAEFMVRQGMRRVSLTLGERGSLAAGTRPDRADSRIQSPYRRHPRARAMLFIGSFAVF